jgi:hypothetical protein
MSQCLRRLVLANATVSNMLRQCIIAHITNGKFDPDSPWQIVRPPTHARDQNPIELAALPPHSLPPRFRALALFERRPHGRVEGLVIADVRKPAQSLTFRATRAIVAEINFCLIRNRPTVRTCQTR